MNQSRRVRISKLPTGVPGLDQVLGEGLPEYSFNLIAGGPGTGKTTLVQQIMFTNSSPDRPALYFTVLGEPTLKMLRYQQQFTFFDPGKIDRSIHFANLSEAVLERGLGEVFTRIVQEVEQTAPGIVIVDSFRTVARSATGDETDLQGFLQRLSIYLTGWQSTSFVVGEYLESELRDNPVFTVADAILWLYQSVERNSIVRKMQVMKMRGQAPMPGLHTFRITEDGIRVFPRMPSRPERARRVLPRQRVSMGVPGLDEMMGGGIPAGDSVLVAGPAGSGKTMLGIQFIAEGVKRDEAGIIAVFEEYPQEYMDHAKALGFDLEEMVAQSKLKMIYLRPLDLSVDETLLEIRESVEQIGAARVVVDSLSGFELALAPTFREDFRESLYRMVGALTSINVTVLMTVEVAEIYDELRFSPHMISFLTDDVILLRYAEIDAQLRRVIMVVKMRSSDHSRDLRLFEATSRGVEVGPALGEYRGIIAGVPKRREVGAWRRQAPNYPGLTVQEAAVLQALVDLREAIVATLAQRSGLRRAIVTTSVDRLVALNYAVRVVEKGRTIYRPAVLPSSS